MDSYRELMNSQPSVPEHLEHGALLTPGILGGPTFVNRLPRRVRNRFQANVTRTPLNVIVQHVAKLWGLRIDEIVSWCREPRLVQARALIAWYATEHGGATLDEVSKFLRRDASTLSRTSRRYRRCHPKLFSRHTFAGLPVSSIERLRATRTASLLSDTKSLPRLQG